MEDEKINGVVLAGPIVSKYSAQRLITGPVLVPGEKDTDGETVNEKKIEDVALKFMETYGNVDVGHTFNNVAVPVESWILRAAQKFQMPEGEILELPKGTWMLSSRVKSDAVWDGIVNKKLRGYSVTGIGLAAIEAAQKSKDTTMDEFLEMSMKRRTLLRDIGDDWIAVAVSIVEDPAVLKSKFIAIKNAAGSKNPFERLFNRLNIFKDEKTVIKEDAEMEMKEFKAAMKEVATEVMNDVVEEKVKPLIQAVEDKIEKAPPEEKAAAETKGEEKSTEEKASDGEEKSNVIDLSEQIGAVQEELLAELQADAPDMKKVERLNAKLETLKEITKGEEEEKPKDMESLQKEIDELKKKFEGDGGDDTKQATKSRAGSGQDGGVDTANKAEDDGLPNRDARGCVKRPPASARQ